MPFTLKVTQGPGAGAEFPFEASEARLGRTSDNDIVVKDAGASRSHARVFQKGARFYVEDLGSANGTRLNDAIISGARELRSGDTIAIGEVVFTFTFTTLDETFIQPPAVTPLANETVLQPVPAAFNPNVTQDITDERPMLEQREQSDEQPAIGRLDVTDERPSIDLLETNLKAPIDRQETVLKPPLDKRLRASHPGHKNPLAPPLVDETAPPSRALAKAGEQQLQEPNDVGSTMQVKVPAPLARRSAARPVEGGDEEALTAAEKARLKRQASKSLAGRLRYELMQLPRRQRFAVLGGAGVLLLAVLGIGAWALMPQKKKALGPEPAELSPTAGPIEASFGLGDGVTYERPDMKVFTFTAASATRLVGVLHYQARDISKDEVAISMNGSDLGFVPPDTLDSANRELELVLPAGQLKRGEVNQVIFDSVHNPPGDDPWRIWNVWLELIAIPDTSPEETVNAVREDLERAQKFYDQRDIGPDTLFKSWKAYRDAWLRMESMTTRPDELYVVARSQLREISTLLDRRCNTMVLDYQKAMSAKKPDRKRAHEVALEMLRYYPSREHHCHGLARALIEETGGF